MVILYIIIFLKQLKNGKQFKRNNYFLDLSFFLLDFKFKVTNYDSCPVSI